MASSWTGKVPAKARRQEMHRCGHGHRLSQFRGEAIAMRSCQTMVDGLSSPCETRCGWSSRDLTKRAGDDAELPWDRAWRRRGVKRVRAEPSS